MDDERERSIREDTVMIWQEMMQGKERGGGDTWERQVHQDIEATAWVWEKGRRKALRLICPGSRLGQCG